MISKMPLFKLIITIFLLMLITEAYGQKIRSTVNWQNLDPTKDSIMGISTDQAYLGLLKTKQRTPIIVAIIDGGVDIGHTDLLHSIWVNPDEIPYNGVDDDKNGFVDDINGWNFLGTKRSTFQYDNAQIVRDLRSALSNKRQFEKIIELSKEINFIRGRFKTKIFEMRGLQKGIDLISKAFQNPRPTVINLKNYKYSSEIERNALIYIVQTMERKRIDFSTVINDFEHQLKDQERQLSLVYNLKYNPRKDHVFKGTHYGNPNVIGPDPTHGTHAAGIIAASREICSGISGIADNAKLMCITAVPIGDILDKDLALAIKYAVDNGAKVLNLSIGTDLSNDKLAVDKAIEYAMEHDVLIVHAGGNEGRHEVRDEDFPSRRLLNGKEASAWIEVGATGPKLDSNLLAPFSNYGKITTDVMAPGIDIYSTLPNNKYGSASGTSMSAPMVSGLAALLWGISPSLKATEIKELILKGVTKVNKKTLTHDGLLIPFSDVCKSSGIINVYQSLLQLTNMGSLK